MMEPLYICPICLRTDRKLKQISIALSVYYDELIDYSLQINNPRYCSECEHLLRKSHNFLRKCSMAANTLKKWLKLSTKDKTSASRLHLKLPPSTLDTWAPETSKVFMFSWSDNLDTLPIPASTLDKPDMNTEVNMSNNLDVMKDETIDNTIHSESLFKMEIHCEDYQITGASETIVQNSNDASGDTRNVFQNKPSNDNIISNVKNTLGYNKLKMNEIINDMTKQVNVTTSSNKAKVESVAQGSYIQVDMDNIKNNINIINMKAKNTLKLKHDIRSANVMPKAYTQVTKQKLKMTPKSSKDSRPTNKVPHFTADSPKLSNNLPVIAHEAELCHIPVTDAIPILIDDMPKAADSHIKSGSADNTAGMDVDLIWLDDDKKSDDVIIIDDENQYPDDASLNSDDDCDDYLYAPHKKTKMQRTLLELVDIALGDDDFHEDSASENDTNAYKHSNNRYSLDMIIAREKRISSKLEAINETLDSVYENWDITSLTDVGIPNMPKNEIKKLTQTFLTERIESEKNNLANMKVLKKIGIKAKITHMTADLDFIHDNCEKIIEDYKNGILEPKERLKADLRKKFEEWGELRADDGFIFDKDVILNCLDMVHETVIKQLLHFLQDTRSITPGAAIILKRIQNKQHENQYESVFSIEYMTTKKEMLEEFNKRKTYDCYVNAEFKCEICYQGFKYQRLLDNHKKCHDENTGSVECSICRLRLHSRRAQKKHMTTHKAVYKCKLCPLVTYYRLSMINHCDQHKGTQYQCERCGNTYKSKSVYLFHQSRAHPRGAHVCTACGGAFISALGLKTHTYRKHRGETPAAAGSGGVKCDFCDYTFLSQEAFERHQLTLHRAPLPYRKRKTPKLTRPRKKIMMTCRVCNAVGHSYGWLTAHISLEHPTVDMAALFADKHTYLCDVCGKGFGNKYNLREHIGFHSGVTFPCPTCEKQFSSRASLRCHQVRHSPPRFCCERCGKKFHTSPNLYNHMRTHIGDRRYKCNICGKGFLHRCSLNEHIRGVHNHERRVRKRGVGESTNGDTDTPLVVRTGAHGAKIGAKSMKAEMALNPE